MVPHFGSWFLTGMPVTISVLAMGQAPEQVVGTLYLGKVQKYQLNFDPSKSQPDTEIVTGTTGMPVRNHVPK